MFELVFQGLNNDSPDSLVKLRGIFVADLDLPVEQARLILESAPAVIRSAEKEEDLKIISQKLQNAGAQVIIVRQVSSPTETQEPTDQPSESAGIEIMPHNDEVQEFSLDIDFDDIQRSIDRTKAVEFETEKNDNVYYLDLTDSTDITAIQQELEKEQLPAEQKSESSGDNLKDNLDELSFETEAPSSKTSDIKTAEKQPHINELSFATEDPGHKIEAQVASIDPVPQVEKADSALEFSLTLKPIETVEENPESSPLNDELCHADTSFDLEIKFDEPPAPKTPPVETPIAQAEPLKNEKTPADNVAIDETLLSADSSKTAAGLSGKEIKTQLEDQPTLVPQQQPSNIEAEQAPATEAGVKISPSAPEKHTNAKAGSKKKGSVFTELGIPIGIGIVVLGVANLLYFSNQEAKPSTIATTKQGVDEIATEVIATKKKAKKSPKTASAQLQPQKISGKNETNGIGAKFDAIVIPNKQMVISFVITTPKPPELNPEDIVHKRARTPWVYSIAVTDWLITFNDKGEFSTQQPVRVYIERWNRRDRVVANAELSGKYEASNSKIMAKLLVTRDIDRFVAAPEALVLCGDENKCAVKVEALIKNGD